ncbi:hypothetical protein SDC9_190369 [bioreactor metagenome]|uniref:Uncharacterized protein n=1 Tax=bioreactor metagenome TaxID=1076179 RepID=A0A645HUS6_9ZZZZ
MHKRALVGEQRNQPHNFVQRELKVLRFHELVAQMLQPTITLRNLLGCAGSQKHLILPITDSDHRASVIFHGLTLRRKCRLVDLRVPP